MATKSENAFRFLSLKDLLDAREAFHVHLMNKENVIGTAVGKYRRRSSGNPAGAKTLDNTYIDDSSWPCLLVFVEKWLTPEEFRRSPVLDGFIPSTVYLPDGREVPVCVIEASSCDASTDLVSPEELAFPSDYIGGGYPLVIQSQGVERIASIGCIVSDGHSYYALTNRHVTGPAGTTVYTKLKGTLVPIGKSAGKQVGNVFFEKVYEGWRSANLVVNADVGLIEITDLNFWKTDIFGLGELGKLVDLNTSNLSLNLIGSPAEAYGCISGHLRGEIAALFYRYKSVGGLEYVCDFLIGPGDKVVGLDTRHGDSGTIWTIPITEPAGKVYRPLAVQWGQHCFVSGGQARKHTYALATCLSNVLRLLEVDIVAGWNTEADYTWGELGHYTIANLATSLVKNIELKTLLQNHLSLITFEQGILKKDTSVKKARQQISYTPLADVPDLVWKIRGGEYQRPLENPNHFADMDKTDSKGQTLLELCSGSGQDMQYLTPQDWLSYYADPDVKDPSKGILPFRAWQIFLKMVEFAGKGDRAAYLAAAGILAHYIGDACQPLHISYMFNGKPSTGGKSGEGVHEAFEAKLVNRYNDEIMTAAQALAARAELITLRSGKEAAAATVQLMKDTFETIAPEEIVDAYIASPQDFVTSFYASTGKTVLPKLFSAGATTLASLWNSAWTLGRGSQNITNLAGITGDDVKVLYERPDFLPSVNIHEINGYLD
ncbi:hypothetical protein [Mucilaginibacter sp. KACC 22063]|uniref:hypothetical protein n=1 Tax=Mucilaginibacter sp. KACC 22063 TaxID=3025666 RepID=UPI00236561BA|nr:hypothetical protein [Mucilaginibacter sp. KACC 22063]WDF57180.1 hypothetical protein PQ461_08950 [Mucilaginibacter sp. KACC 22063]